MYPIIYQTTPPFTVWHVCGIILIMIGLATLALVMHKLDNLEHSSLSERRLDNYLLFKEFYTGFERSMHLLTDITREAFVKNYKYVFDHFLDTPYWSSLGSIFNGNEITRQKFYDNLQQLHGKAEEARLLFSDERIATYYDLYADFLVADYEYYRMSGKEKDEPEYRLNVFITFNKLAGIHKDIKDIPISRNDLKL